MLTIDRQTSYSCIDNQSNEVRFYLPFLDWFGIKLYSAWFQIKGEMANTIRYLLKIRQIISPFLSVPK